MCKECGCGQVDGFGVQPMQAPPGKPVRLVSGDDATGDPGHGHWHTHADGTSHSHPRDHDHDHAHPHDHDHAHGHGHVHGHEHAHDVAAVPGSRVIDIARPILERNQRLAERNRGFLAARGLSSVNLVSAPGAGKTTLVERTVGALGTGCRAAVIVGDLATARDAERIRAAGAPVVQITTGTVCHLDAEMVARGIEQLDLADCRLLIIENVGNLVCPADFDLGEGARVAVVSVTEGEDKPLKYPPIFRSAHAVVITKIDIAEAAGADVGALRRNVGAVSPNAAIFELSARTGQGMDAWLAWLRGLAADRRLAGAE